MYYLLWLVAIIPVGFYVYFKFVVYAYWKKRGISHDTPSVLFGNVLPLIWGKMNIADFFRENYEKFRKHNRFHGMYVFHRPVLIINDPNLIRQILIEQFDKFNGRGTFNNEKIDPLSIHLFSISGDKWKMLRQKLTPSFTPNKLKEIFPLIKEISDELTKTCDRILEDGDHVIEIKDFTGRYTIDIISSIAYGFNCKSLSDPDSEFNRYGAMALNKSPLLNILIFYAPKVMDVLRIPYFSKDVIRFFSKTFQDVIKYRRQNDIVRKDFVNVLMQLIGEKSLNGIDQKSDANTTLTITDAQAQSFLFFLAGFETSSSTMTYLLYELAINAEIQEKIQEEIDELLANGEINYSTVMDELPYLDMTVLETIRKYPSFPILNRCCNADWQIPNSNYTIKQGTAVIIPVAGLHYNQELYPEPEKFDPLRFRKTNDSTKIPSGYLPFGAGPKICLGSRLAMFQIKLGLVALITNYKFSTCKQTIIPIRHSTYAVVQKPSCGMYLRMERRMKK